MKTQAKLHALGQQRLCSSKGARIYFIEHETEHISGDLDVLRPDTHVFKLRDTPAARFKPDVPSLEYIFLYMDPIMGVGRVNIDKMLSYMMRSVLRMIAVIRTLSEAVSGKLFGFVGVNTSILNTYSSSCYQ